MEHVRVAVSTAASGTWDITTGSGVSATPVAAMFYVTSALVDDTITSDAIIGWGATDGTNEACLTVACEDAQVTSDTARRRDITKSIMLHDVGGSYQFQFSFNSWIDNGVRLNIDNSAPSGYLLKAVFFYAEDVDEATVVNIGLGSTTSPIVYTGLTYEPDVLFTGHIYTTSTANSDHSTVGLGMVYNDVSATPTQKSMAMCGDSGSASGGDQNTYIDNTRGLCATLLGTHRWSVTFSDISATGFTHTNSGSTSTIMQVLALKLATGVSFDLFDMNWPTTGNFTKSTSFEAAFGGMFTMIGPTAYNTFSTATDNVSLGLTTFDGSTTYTESFTDHDGQDPTVCKSLSSNQLRILDSDGATDAVLAPGISISASSIDATITTNPTATAYGFGWIMGSSAPSGITLVGDLGTDVASVSGTITIGGLSTKSITGDLQTDIASTSGTVVLGGASSITLTGTLNTDVASIDGVIAKPLYAMGILETPTTSISGVITVGASDEVNLVGNLQTATSDITGLITIATLPPITLTGVLDAGVVSVSGTVVKGNTTVTLTGDLTTPLPDLVGIITESELQAIALTGDLTTNTAGTEGTISLSFHKNVSFWGEVTITVNNDSQGVGFWNNNE